MYTVQYIAHNSTSPHCRVVGFLLILELCNLMSSTGTEVNLLIVLY
jgi:hypothetical protein